MTQTINLGGPSNDIHDLDRVCREIIGCKKVVCLAGAGISTSAGIPDFRSEQGLYRLMEDAHHSSSSSSSSRPIKGKDLFSASVLADPSTRSTFYRVMAAMHSFAASAQPTPTHDLFTTLAKKGRLVRVYTQNIDGLEARAGLEQASTSAGTSSSSATILSPTKTSKHAGNGSKASSSRPTGQVVHLHGQASQLRCELGTCTYRTSWTPAIHSSYSLGQPVSCPGCLSLRTEKLALGKRIGGLRYGNLRPAITLYDEPATEEGNAIGDIQMRDLRSAPDCALIFGTTLQVKGFKSLVKEFSKAVHDNGGVVVFVNLGAPTKEWDEYIDWHVQGKTDDFADHLTSLWRKVRPQEWQHQTTLASMSTKASSATVVKKSSATVYASKPRPSSAPSMASASTSKLLSTPSRTVSPLKRARRMADQSDLSDVESSSDEGDTPLRVLATPSQRRKKSSATVSAARASPLSPKSANKRVRKSMVRDAAPVTPIRQAMQSVSLASASKKASNERSRHASEAENASPPSSPPFLSPSRSTRSSSRLSSDEDEIVSDSEDEDEDVVVRVARSPAASSDRTRKVSAQNSPSRYRSKGSGGSDTKRRATAVSARELCQELGIY